MFRARHYIQYFQGINPGLVLLLSAMSLILLGLVMLASASQTFNQGNTSIFIKQLGFLAIALVGGGLAAFINLEKLREYTPQLALGAFVLLIVVLIPGVGVKVNGARRWLGAGPLRFQASSFAMVAMVLFMAYYIAHNQRKMRAFREGFMTPCIIIGTVCLLILAEPDFGTAFLCASVGFTLLFLTGARLSYLLPTVFAGVCLFAIAIAFNPNRLSRLLAFLDVQANKADGTYQLWQGILAFGSGGWLGVGLGNGRQQMAYLPEAHTDFIFSIIGEELGFVATAGTVMVFALIFWSAIYAIRKAPNIYYFTLTMGSLLFITLQAIMNLGVVVGIFPTKGIALPFISYGGSNLLMMCIFVGLLINAFASWDVPISTRSQHLRRRIL